MPLPGRLTTPSITTTIPPTPAANTIVTTITNNINVVATTVNIATTVFSHYNKSTNASHILTFFFHIYFNACKSESNYLKLQFPGQNNFVIQTSHKDLMVLLSINSGCTTEV
ncbi:hypothetical protein L1987_65829 [Smallanthus sonchifolius]|uniref:Uncharacterized protein n=1 Tax=Smallanthus sonchifolius TaxID=185202 RepID=A0ACB9BVE8_9ASTR|nr:hypothetical protein L1987_65829 [Smallanthus sonchifolius]